MLHVPFTWRLGMLLSEFNRLCGNEMSMGFTNSSYKTEVKTRCSLTQCCVDVYKDELYIFFNINGSVHRSMIQ